MKKVAADHIIYCYACRATPPTVSEEARERAVSVAYAAMVEAKKLGPDVLAANRWLDRIIDALGYLSNN
jgi:hypothetical protein